MSKHSPAPWHWRIYANDPDEVEMARKHGIEPIRLLTNEGQIALMAGEEDGRKRVALVDCQTKYKRGEGYRTECAERDANARLIAAAPDMLAVCQQVACEFDDAKYPHSVEGRLRDLARAAIAKATGTP